MKPENFKPGIYRHFKGILYEADHLMRDANEPSRIGVHYIGLETKGASDGPRHLIRTWEDWAATVHTDGTVCGNHIDGVCKDTGAVIMPRFSYLGPFYVIAMSRKNTPS